ncbi:hypothetical protein BDN72DRAFT_873372 [Pluteus cervinus]|uniref:Uncharacterized protein n=1 Tax=Pluteus cervinus TaxID=181527 RepID=A0ACD3BGR6_9AGAR|nr:hypothetical protein BDN72DRAFT_873372 [Pluteus cervinus]
MLSSFVLISITFLTSVSVLATPAPNPDHVTSSLSSTSSEVHNAISGFGGPARGGSVNCGHRGLLGVLGLSPLLNLGSNNAGSGGVSSSGDAVAAGALRPIKFARWNTDKNSHHSETDNASSGPAGDASGGDTCGNGLINLFSNHAGHGGISESGDATSRDSP